MIYDYSITTGKQFVKDNAEKIRHALHGLPGQPDGDAGDGLRRPWYECRRAGGSVEPIPGCKSLIWNL